MTNGLLTSDVLLIKKNYLIKKIISIFISAHHFHCSLIFTSVNTPGVTKLKNGDVKFLAAFFFVFSMKNSLQIVSSCYF